MQITVEESNTVNIIHIVILAIEGVFLVLVAAGYVWYLTKMVSVTSAWVWTCVKSVKNARVEHVERVAFPGASFSIVIF